jgi:hypothetical protein
MIYGLLNWKYVSFIELDGADAAAAALFSTFLYGYHI